MFGLPETVVKLLSDYFASQPEIVKVLIFGSRALGTQKSGSDVDLAIVTTSDRDLSGSVQASLDALPTPYLFDVVDYNKISHFPLREHIDRVGKIFYCRPQKS